MLYAMASSEPCEDVNLINEKLRGTKRLDLFQCARVDSQVSVKETAVAHADDAVPLFYHHHEWANEFR